MGNPFKKAKRALKKVFKAPKKLAQKLVPKELAGIMQMAAPFMGPVAGPVAYGLGSLKQRGRINPLMMALTMAPHMRFAGGRGITQFRPTGYGGPVQYGKQSLRNLFLRGEDLSKLDYSAMGENLPKSWDPILGDTGKWIDEKLWGLPERDVSWEVGAPHGPGDAMITRTGTAPATTGWLGSEGIAGTFADEGARQALTESKLAGVLLGKEGDLTKGVDLLKSVAWGSAIIGGIQAGKYKDAMEAAQAAEDAARADGITDSEWLETARAEAAAYWDAWDQRNLAQGGRVGYRYGTEREGVQSLPRNQMQEIEGQMAAASYDDIQKRAEALALEIFGVEDFWKLLPRYQDALWGRAERELNEKAQGGRVGYRYGTEREGVQSLRGDQMQEIEGQMAGGEYNRAMELMLKIRENIPLTEEEKLELQELMKTLNLAQGGRVDYQFGIGPVGGIQGISPMRPQLPMNPQAASMNVPPPKEGGLGRLPIEADMRYTGGFMPYGEEEKADDVPARLSKNEFVFTADAVRAAGGGSVNQGAKKLYDTMKQLEAQV